MRRFSETWRSLTVFEPSFPGRLGTRLIALAFSRVAAAAGAATGGIFGALTEAGVSKEEAPLYAEGVSCGGTLVSVRVADNDRAQLETVMNQSSVDLRDRSTARQKSGWKTFDPASQPFGPMKFGENVNCTVFAKHQKARSGGPF